MEGKTGSATSFQDVPSRYDGVKLEEAVLALWREHDMFNEAQRQHEGRPLYCWNEGPPTANGRPGIHHVLARTFKDIFPRFKHMQGYHCPRKAGWDTHGLPVEHEIEKELGIFDKAEIERQVGVAEFTRRCRESVMRYIGDWERMTERMGFWVNMGDAYYTLDNSFIESVWWLLRRIWDKGLIYQGYKVVPYDPRIGATLSSHEVALGYKEVEDPSVYVRFPVEGEAFACEDGGRTSFLVWTTTPWTLPSNLALAVHPEVDYAFVHSGGETLILAEALVGAVLRDAEHTIERRVKGTELEGMRYTRLFDHLPADGPICQVWAADFVTVEDGTGIVHCAPAYGEDDIRLCQAKGLPVVHGVGLDGCFVHEVEPVAGKFFKDADPILVADLESRGLMYRSERYLHNYPHGWRTGDPLIYYAKHAWYIGTSRIRDRMVELNRTINWVPETIRDGRFGNWLANNVDWALSRERFWGTPLPVWTDGEGDFVCIGSIAELEGLCGRSLEGVDLHRPAVDEITFVHPDNGRTYRRVPEVIDCWFDSGAMSYAQFHYPFENRELFASRFPADYICEAIDQTRGWFYSLHAIAALVSDSVAYRNCICLAHIVDKDGKKMSKSIGNIVDPYDVFDHVGADPLRWYLSCRIAPEVQKRISVDFVRGVASGFINTWWNTYAFFVMYAKLDRIDVTDDVPLADRPEIDRWALALLHRTVADVTDALEAYDVFSAGRAIESFVDQLSNWYVRRNRRRFWKAAAGRDKQAAYLTLYECLHTVNRLMAPIMPFITETVHQNLVRGVDDGAPPSVHMSGWPAPDPAARDDALIAEIDVVQRVVGLGRAARNSSGVPGAAATLAASGAHARRSGGRARRAPRGPDPRGAEREGGGDARARRRARELSHQAQPAPHRQAVRQARPGGARRARRRGRRRGGGRGGGRPVVRRGRHRRDRPVRARGRARRDDFGRGLLLGGGGRLPRGPGHDADRGAGARGPRPGTRPYRAGSAQAGGPGGLRPDHAAHRRDAGGCGGARRAPRLRDGGDAGDRLGRRRVVACVLGGAQARCRTLGHRARASGRDRVAHSVPG